MYPKIASSSSVSTVSYDVDKKVEAAINNFLCKLSQIGPEILSGSLTLSFFERRKTQQLFGLVSNEEQIVWEQWHLRVVVNNTPRPISNDSALVIERQRVQDTNCAMIRSVLIKTYEIAISTVEDIPPTMYEFEINCPQKIDDRENVYSRVTNMPNLINLIN
jgi:hypothetical protein